MDRQNNRRRTNRNGHERQEDGQINDEKRANSRYYSRRANNDANDTDASQSQRRSNRRRAREDSDEQHNESAPNEQRRAVKETKKGFFQFTWKKLIIVISALILLSLIGYTTILYGGKLITNEEKLVISPPTTIETEDGEILWYLYDEYRLPVNIDQIPEHVQDAFVAIEDKRFYSHSGVDLRSIFRALYRDIVARDKKEGASTITQQLAKNLFLTNDKTWWRKIKEAMIALHLEREFSKEKLLEMYLNVIYFGQGQYGIEAASNKFFHKSVDELTLEEGALLAGIIKAPNGYSPIDHPEKAQNRRDLVLRTMNELGYIDENEMTAAREKEITLNISTQQRNPAYHTITDLVIKEAEQVYGITLEQLRSSRYRIVTSLDEEIQEIVYDQFQYDGYFPGNKKENVEGTFVMMEEQTGAIVAALGGRKYEIGNLNRVTKRRQPGSTIKPIAVYAPALETGQYNAYSILPDELSEWNGHEVRNYDNNYEGTITLYDAIVKSKNSSAYWLLNEIGINESKKYLSLMDINIEDKGLSIALGGLKEGLTPIELVEAYRTFIHNGEKIDAHIISEIYNYKNQLVADAQFESKQVFSEQVAWDMTEMLKEVINSGTGRAGYYPYELAGKTGSTQHVQAEGNTKDAWFVGYTPQYVTSLWMGYDVSDEEHYLTGGSSYPTELTKKILTEVDKRKSLVQTFKKPDNVQALAEPIRLPEIENLIGTYTFGGFKILKGKLQWTPANDARIVYNIYEQDGDNVKKIGEVVGDGEFIIDEFMLFKSRSYYVVPYDPIAEQEGTKSNTVSLP